MKIYKYVAKDRPAYVIDGGYACIGEEVIGFGVEEAATEITVEEAISRGDATEITGLLNSKGINTTGSSVDWLVQREKEYASIGDQLDMHYHDTVDGTTTWIDHISGVKTKHPKPNV